MTGTEHKKLAALAARDDKYEALINSFDEYVGEAADALFVGLSVESFVAQLTEFAEGVAERYELVDGRVVRRSDTPL